MDTLHQIGLKENMMNLSKLSDECQYLKFG